MRKYIFLILLFNVVLIRHADGFDIKGLQPLAPYGVFSAFSAESLKKDKFALGAGFERAEEPDFYRYVFQFAYGLKDDVEIIATIPYVTEWYNESSGFEDIAFGLKHRFIDEGKYGPSVAYIVSASASAGKDEFSTGGRVGAGIIVSKRVGPVSGHTNLFYERNNTTRLKDELSFAAGFDFSAGHHFKILGEVYGRKSHYSGEIDQVEGRFGYRFLTRDYLLTTIGIGYDFKNENPNYRFMLSVTFLLPIEEKEIKKIYEEKQ